MPTRLPGSPLEEAIAECTSSESPTSATDMRREYSPSMAIIYFIVMGIIIGALARLLIPGRQKIGMLLTILLGVAGAVIGGVVASLLGTGRVGNMNTIGFIVALIASVGLVAAAEAAGIGRGQDDHALGGRRGLTRR
jgi:uncharacterized membrane protein YeaQ/YmgE (transglycosylase-associated protein family)